MDFPPFMMIYHKQLKSPIPAEPRQLQTIGHQYAMNACLRIADKLLKLSFKNNTFITSN